MAQAGEVACGLKPKSSISPTVSSEQQALMNCRHGGTGCHGAGLSCDAP